MSDGLVLHFPTPISINTAYGNRKSGSGRGRYKTGDYRRWLARADEALIQQKHAWHNKEMSGPLALNIKLPMDTRGDVDNRIKVLSDYLVSRRLTGDDRHNQKVSVERADVPCCVVTITRAGE